MDLADRLARRQVHVLAFLLASVAIVTFAGDSRFEFGGEAVQPTRLQGEVALRMAEQAGLDLGTVIETVSHSIESPRGRQGMHGSEDRRSRPSGTLVGDRLPRTVPESVLRGAAYPLTIEPLASFNYPASDASEAPGAQVKAAVAFDGTNYLVVWEDQMLRLGQHLRRAGQPGRHRARRLRDRDLDRARLPAGARARLRRHELPRRLDRPTLGRGRHLRRACQSGGRRPRPGGIAISTAPSSQYESAIAFDGMSYLVAWADRRRGAQRTSTARASPRPAPSRPRRGRDLHRAELPLFPAIAFDGTNYLVVWEDQISARATSTARALARPAPCSTRAGS